MFISLKERKKPFALLYYLHKSIFKNIIQCKYDAIKFYHFIIYISKVKNTRTEKKRKGGNPKNGTNTLRQLT